MSNETPPPVELDELLAAEYNYIAQTAIQAHEDRARISSFYLIAVGSLVAALLGAQFFDPSSPSQDVNLMFSGVFVLLTLLGTSTIVQVARLRAAWYESALAMNQLKDYMMEQNQSLVKAFRWQTGTLPGKTKKNSISYYQAVEIALISGLMFSAAVFFFQRAFWSTGILHWIIAVIAGGASVYFQLLAYRRALK